MVGGGYVENVLSFPNLENGMDGLKWETKQDISSPDPSLGASSSSARTIVVTVWPPSLTTTPHIHLFVLARRQAGTPETDTFHDAAAVSGSPSTVATMAATGTSAAGDESTAIILAGFTKGGWDGAASAGGSDFVAVSVASGDGSQLWSWQVRRVRGNG